MCAISGWATLSILFVPPISKGGKEQIFLPPSLEVLCCRGKKVIKVASVFTP